MRSLRDCFSACGMMVCILCALMTLREEEIDARDTLQPVKTEIASSPRESAGVKLARVLRWPKSGCNLRSFKRACKYPLCLVLC